MKSFLTYSGKGGVGKSTTTYCLYMAFKALGKTVTVLDMDLNTPSMHYLMPDDDLISNKDFKGLFLNKSVVDMFLTRAITTITKRNADILLIDTPPSITDIHISIIKKLKLNAVILVSQPSELSKADVERTVPFFENEGVTVMGIIENMVESNGLQYNYPKLLSVNKERGLESKQVYTANSVAFAELTAELLTKNLVDVSQENKQRIIFDETIDWDKVKAMYWLTEDEYGDVYIDGKGFRKAKHTVSDIKFVNLQTWAKLHSAIESMNREATEMFGGRGLKDQVSEATYERVERLVNAFKVNEVALFMVCKNPHTQIPTICGEIGECTLKIDDKFHGIPSVEYQTSKGSVRMFPHEVIPVEPWMIEECLAYGGQYFENGKRLIPSVELASQYAGAYGRLVGMPDTEEGVINLWERVTETKYTPTLND